MDRVAAPITASLSKLSVYPLTQHGPAARRREPHLQCHAALWIQRPTASSPLPPIARSAFLIGRMDLATGKLGQARRSRA